MNYSNLDEVEVGEYWNNNAHAWTELSRAGFDIYRDVLNTPSFLAHMPNIIGLYGIDIGCGEGYNTRLLANNGANMTGVDISIIFIENALQMEKMYPLGNKYLNTKASQLPFKHSYFDFATSFMCMMDIPNVLDALKEVYRVLKPGGFFQFSISHPCFTTPYRRNKRTKSKITYAIEVGEYFLKPAVKIEEWTFGCVPENVKNIFTKFKIPVFHRTLSEWINLIVAAGFYIEEMNEPSPTDELILKYPSLQDAQVVAYFLHLRCRK